MKEITLLAIEHASLVQKHYCDESVVISGFNPIGKSIRYTPWHMRTLLEGFAVTVKCVDSFSSEITQSSDEMALLHLGWLGVSEGVIEQVRSLVGGFVRSAGEEKTHCVLSIEIEPTEGVWEVTILIGNQGAGESISTKVTPVESLYVHGIELVLDATVVNPYVFCASVTECASRGGTALVKTRGVMPLAGVFSLNCGLERFVYESFLQGARTARHLFGLAVYEGFGIDYNVASIVAPAIGSRKHTRFDYSAKEHCTMSAVGISERALVQVDSGRVKLLIKPANAHSVKTLIAEAFVSTWQYFDMDSINNYSITIDSLERAQSFDSLVMDFGVAALYEKLCTGEGKVMGSFTLFLTNYFCRRNYREMVDKLYNCTALVLETGEVLSKEVSVAPEVVDNTLTLSVPRPNSLFARTLMQVQITEALNDEESFNSVLLKSFDSEPYKLEEDMLVFISDMILRKARMERDAYNDWNALLSSVAHTTSVKLSGKAASAYLIKVDTDSEQMVSVVAA